MALSTINIAAADARWLNAGRPGCSRGAFCCCSATGASSCSDRKKSQVVRMHQQPAKSGHAAGDHAVSISRRGALLSCCLLLPVTAAGFSSSGDVSARAAILEADEDDELMERIKQDRKKRLERQVVVSSAAKEKGYLQEVIYKLSQVGQAIEKSDLSAASSVLGPSSDAAWVKNVNSAFGKLSSTREEENEANVFNASLSSLFTSVGKRDAESSKSAFLLSASSLEKWVGLAGLVGDLKGL